MASTRLRPTLALLFLLALALPSTAKEESKIKVRMDKLGGGPVQGDVATRMSANSAELHLKARHLDPDAEYVLYNDATPDMDDGAELARFMPSGNGSVNLKIDLLSLGLGADADPRGKRLSLYDVDADEDVLEVWIFEVDGDAMSNRLRPKAKEWTDLAIGEDNVDEEGVVGARYKVNPNGKARLELALRGVPAGTYAVYVDDVLVADDVVPNPSGNAKISFRSQTKGKGRSKPHNKKLELIGFDPYLATIDLRQGDDVFFSGPMAAQVDGLNACEPDPRTASLTAEQSVDDEGSVTTGFDASCRSGLEVQVSGPALPATLFLYVNEELVGSFAPPGAEFDDAGASGDPVRIDDGAGTIYFSGSLP